MSPASGPTGIGSSGEDGGVFSSGNDKIPPPLIPHGQLLSSDNPFVKWCAKMFPDKPEAELRMIGTILSNNMQKMIGDEISRENRRSHENRKRDLRIIQGQE